MPHRQIKKNVNKLLIGMYMLMVTGLIGSLGFALYQNWHLKIQSTQNELSRQASIGNFIVANAIANASKSLRTVQQALQRISNEGPVSALQAHELLRNALNDFTTYSNAPYEGLLLYLDPRGELLVRTDHYPAERLDFSDRFYFQRLKAQPELEQTISPLVKARTTGEWVFHVAMPIKDKAGALRGVLAQQIRATDIAQEMNKYIGPLQAGQLVSQTSDAGISFVYPLQLLTLKAPSDIETPYSDFARRSTSPQDAFIWPPSGSARGPQFLVGYEYSELSGFLSTMHLPLDKVWLDFLEENVFLLGIASIALLLITALFMRLHRISNHLSDALYESFSDTLTRIPNRRAFEDMYPRLLREAVRSRQPLSALFIDIDHFKKFNDDYGHDGGDIALKAVAQALQSCAERPLDFVCRWGGEEFVMLLPHTPEDSALLLADRVLDAVRQLTLTDLQGRAMRRVSVSIGLACDTVISARLSENLVTNADIAMQQAKGAGRDRCVVYVAPQ